MEGTVLKFAVHRQTQLEDKQDSKVMLVAIIPLLWPLLINPSDNQRCLYLVGV
jgi:hypothetical protein